MAVVRAEKRKSDAIFKISEGPEFLGNHCMTSTFDQRIKALFAADLAGFLFVLGGYFWGEEIGGIASNCQELTFPYSDGLPISASGVGYSAR